MIKENSNYSALQEEWHSLLKTGAETITVTLSEEQIRQFALYWRELQEWNSHINITAISSLKDTIIKHFLDSLSVIESLPWFRASGRYRLRRRFPRNSDCNSAAGPERSPG